MKFFTLLFLFPFITLSQNNANDSTVATTLVQSAEGLTLRDFTVETAEIFSLYYSELIKKRSIENFRLQGSEVREKDIFINSNGQVLVRNDKRLIVIAVELYLRGKMAVSMSQIMGLKDGQLYRVACVTPKRKTMTWIGNCGAEIGKTFNVRMLPQ